MDWTDESHGVRSPDYEGVFDRESLLEVRIEIAPQDYQAMQADMTELAGELGEGDPMMGRRPPPPPELFEACVDLEEGDPCEAALDGIQLGGSCTRGPFPDLFCLPEGPIPGGPPPGGGEGGLTLLPGEPKYVPVDVIVGELRWRHVGMRYKGNSSLSFSWQMGVLKLPFRLHFDKYEDAYPEITNQRFYGFKKLTFSSGFHDNAQLREALVGEVLEGRGVPVARHRFAKVTVDFGTGPVYYGLYTMIEDPADAMAERLFGQAPGGAGMGGNVYKPDGPGADWRGFDAAGFVKKSNRAEADWSDVQAAIAALHAPRGEASWRRDLEQVFDAPGFVRWLAVNTFLGNWDAYGVAAHNYYLFGDPETGRLHWVPWDHNEALKDSGGGASFGTPPTMGLAEIDEAWPLIRFLIDDPIYWQQYLDELEAVRAALAEPAFEARLRALHDRIAPAIEAERPPYTTLSSLEAFERSVPALLRYLARRQVDARALLAP